MFIFPEQILSATSFMPHGMCYLWKPGLVGIHLFSNALIALSYFSIPFFLVRIVRQRQDIPFNWIIILFAAFIISCGVGHTLDIWTLWYPNYWFSGAIRALTAVISVIAAIALFNLQSEIIALPSTAQIEETNNRLMAEIKERQQIEEALRKSEQRWQLVLKGTGDGIFDWNIITGEAFLSQTLKENLGYQDEEVTNSYKGWRQLVYPGDIELVEQEIEAHLARKTPQYFCEYRMQCKDGKYKWILARGMAQWNQEDKPIRMVGSLQDISIRKQAETEIARLNQELEARVVRRTAQLEASNRLKDDLLIREQQARDAIEIYEDLVNNIPLGLSIWHLQDNNQSSFELVEINPLAAQLLKLDRVYDRGKLMSECLPSILGPSHQVVVEAYAEVVDSGEVKNFSEVRYSDKKLKDRIFAVTAFPLPEQCLGIAFEDITVRKSIEQALAESTRQYRLVVNNIKEVIFQTDLEGHWTFLNTPWIDITGYTIMESLNHSFIDYIVKSDDQFDHQELFQAMINQKQESLQFIFQIQTKSQNERWVEMNVQPNLDKQQQIVGSSGTIRDISEKRKAEAQLQARANELAKLNQILLQTTAQLERRNKELDQFAYVTSHDLKAPLRAIANLSEWIEEDLADRLDEDTKMQMDLLRGRVHRMENLINGLLHYSRVGRFQNQPETVDVGELLVEVVESVDPPPEFSINIEGQMPVLVTERLPLRQVFSNLISNGIKHHDREDGTINISVQEQEKFYLFTISDDGPGIAPDYHQKVFVIFQTLEARDKNENTGIGLSIVKKTIESQGGKIELESSRGKGTTFHFTWPKQIVR